MILFLGFMLIIPFIAVGLFFASLVGLRLRPALIAGVAGGVVAVVTMWITIYTAVVVFLHPLSLPGETPWWMNIAYPLAAVTLPVFLLGTIAALVASRSERDLRTIS